MLNRFGRICAKYFSVDLVIYTVMCVGKVKCISFEKRSIFGDLLCGMLTLFYLLWGSREKICMLVLIRLIEKFSEEAVIPLVLSYVSG